MSREGRGRSEGSRGRTGARVGVLETSGARLGFGSPHGARCHPSESEAGSPQTSSRGIPRTAPSPSVVARPRPVPRRGRGGSTRGKPGWVPVLVFALLALWPLPITAVEEAADTVVVGSKNFEESRLLAEVFAQTIEARTGLAVERRLNLAGTQVCFEALRTGAIDLYPEYTGTGLASILGEEPLDRSGAGGDAAATLARVRRAFLERWDLHWLAPLGFENAYELAVPRSLAERHGLATITDLAPLAPELAAGFGYEFVDRPDGLPGLAAAYGLSFASVRTLQQALKYRAAATGEVEVLDVYTTDGRLLTYDLAVLEDDRGFFPPYEAAPLVRGATLEEHPEVAVALGLLGGALDEERMRRLNARLQEEGAEPATVAAELLRDLGLSGDVAAARRCPGPDRSPAISGPGARSSGA